MTIFDHVTAQHSREGMLQAPGLQVVIESPFKSDDKDLFQRNMFYARRAMLHSLSLGEIPFASHLLYTQVLDDSVSFERQAGIDANIAMIRGAAVVAVYSDYGVSEGMEQAVKAALETYGIPLSYRRIGKNEAMTEDEYNLLQARFVMLHQSIGLTR